MSSDEDKEKTRMIVDNVHIHSSFTLERFVLLWNIYIWILSTISVVFSLYVYIHIYIWPFLWARSSMTVLLTTLGGRGALAICILQVKTLEHRELNWSKVTQLREGRSVLTCSSHSSSCSQAPAVLSYKGEFLTPAVSSFLMSSFTSERFALLWNMHGNNFDSFHYPFFAKFLNQPKPDRLCSFLT